MSSELSKLYDRAELLYKSNEDVQQAKVLFQKILDRHPGTIEAEGAKIYIARIDQEEMSTDNPPKSENIQREKILKIFGLWVVGGMVVLFISAATGIMEIGPLGFPLLAIVVLYLALKLKCERCGKHPGIWTALITSKCFHCSLVQK